MKSRERFGRFPASRVDGLIIGNCGVDPVRFRKKNCVDASGCGEAAPLAAPGAEQLRGAFREVILEAHPSGRLEPRPGAFRTFNEKTSSPHGARYCAVAFFGRIQFEQPETVPARPVAQDFGDDRVQRVIEVGGRGADRPVLDAVEIS